MIKKKRLLAMLLVIELIVCSVPKLYMPVMGNDYNNEIKISDMSGSDDGGIKLSFSKENISENEVELDLQGRIRYGEIGDGEQGYGINVELTLPDSYYDDNELYSDENNISVSIDGIDTEFEVINDYENGITSDFENTEISENIASSGEPDRKYPIIKFNMKLVKDKDDKFYEVVVNWADNFSFTYIIKTDNLIFENVIEDINKTYYYNLPEDISGEINYRDNLGNELSINSIYVDDELIYSISEDNNETEAPDNINYDNKKLTINKEYIKNYYDNTQKAELNMKIKLGNDDGIVTSLNFIINIDMTNAYYVAFYSNEGNEEIYYEYMVLEGEKIEELPDNPQLDNYIFKGWREADKGDIIDFEEYIVSDGDKTIMGVWELDTYNKVESCNNIIFEGKNYYKDKAVIKPKVEDWKIGITEDEFYDFVEVEDVLENEEINLYLTDGTVINKVIDYKFDGIIDTESPQIEVYHIEEELTEGEKKDVCSGNTVIYVKVKDNDYFNGEELKGNSVQLKVNDKGVICTYNNEKSCFVGEFPTKNKEEYVIDVTAVDRVGHETVKSYTVVGNKDAMYIKTEKIYKNGKSYDEEYKEKQYISYTSGSDNYELRLEPSSTNGISVKNWNYSYSIDGKDFNQIKLENNKILIVPLNEMTDGSHEIKIVANSNNFFYNVEREFIYNINVDNNGPVISNEKYNDNYYFSDDEKISIDYYDGNGVDNIYVELYKYDENSQEDNKYEKVRSFDFSKEPDGYPVSGTLTFSEEYSEYYKSDGQYKIAVVSTDRFGIKGDEYEFYFNVDHTSPVLNSFIRTGIDKEANQCDMSFVNSDIKIELKVTDNLSGVKQVLYSTSGYNDAAEPAVYNNGAYVIDIHMKNKEITDEKLYITLIDNQDNVINCDEKISIKIDNQPAVITDIKTDNDNYTNGNIMLSANISDGSGSGIKKVEWSENGGETYKDLTEFCDSDGQFKADIKENGYYKIKVTDIVDNVSESEMIYVNNIDKQNPDITKLEIKTDDNDPEWKSSKAKITVKAKDEGTSGLKEMYWIVRDDDNNKVEEFNGIIKYTDSQNKNEITEISFEITNLKNLDDGKYSVEVYVKDNADNFSKVKSTELFVDHTPPALEWNIAKSHTVDGEAWYGKSDLNNNFKIEINAEDEKSGLTSDNNIKISINGQLLTRKNYSITGGRYKKTISINSDIWRNINGKYEIKAEVTDDTLNNSTTITKVFNTDSTNPQITEFNMKVSGNDGNADGDGMVVRDNSYGYYFKKPATAYIYAKDDNASAGIKSITYFLCEKGQNYDKARLNAITQNVDNENKIAVNIPENFKGQIYALATDKVGNTSDNYVKPAAIVIDNHKKDTDAITITRPVTAYKDNTGMDLYNSNVSVGIDIKDVTSGIREVNWKVESINDTSANYEGSLYINNSGQISGESADVITSEENLKTHLRKDITVSNNDNNIKVTVTMKDRAGNISTAENVFSIDKTTPTINISYDNNSPDSDNTEYFNRDRTATITVRERNFNPDDVNLHITNTQGNIPALSEWTIINGTGNRDDTLHRATLQYTDDGDYTFEISYSDNAGNRSVNTFVQSSVSPDKFTIDKTSPILNVNYDNDSSVNGSYYQNFRTAIFTINEHNFDLGRFEINITENGSQINKDVSWTGEGDIHTARVLLDNEALYNIQANYRDMAGNTINGQYTSEFYIDKNIPELIISGVENRTPYTQKVISFNISSSDTYFDNVLMNLELVKSDGSHTDIIKDNIQKSEDVEISISNINNGKQLSISNLVSDGIYKLSCMATDKSGRSVNKDILFSVNREGPTYFIDDSATLSVKDKYLKSPQDIVFNEINVNELYSDTIKITVFRGNSNWDLVEGKDYTVEKAESEDKWCEYKYIIKKENFVENGIYHVAIASKDRADNDAISEKFSFIIDNQPPLCNIFDLKNNKVYVSDSRNVRFKLTDNIALASVKVMLNNKEILSLEGDGLIKELGDENVISFDISSSNSVQNLVISYTDMAGNEDSIAVSNFYVTKNMWIRFVTNTPLVAGTVAAIILAVSLAAVLIIRNNKRKNN